MIDIRNLGLIGAVELQPMEGAPSKRAFEAFLRGEGGRAPHKDFTIPAVVDGLIRSKRGTVKVLDTTSRWFGVTYREDKGTVQASIRDLVAAGEYPAKL